MAKYQVKNSPQANIALSPLAQIHKGYVFINNNLSHWDKLLDNWIDNIESFASTNGNPYQDCKEYEICNVGILLSAASKIPGSTVLCETAVDFNKKLSGRLRGRLDMWMQLSTHEIELISAKATTHKRLTKKSGERDKYDYMFLKDESINYLNNLDLTGLKSPHSKVAINFYIPLIKSKPPEKDTEIDSEIHDDIVSVDWDLTAWCFPKPWVDNIYRNDTYPGIILSAKKLP
jgi:hypothetical protein